MRAIKHIIIAIILFCGASVANADPVLIRLSYIVPVSNWATLLMEKSDIAKHWNKSYKLEIIHFQGTPELVQAQAINELEIGNHGYSSFAYGILNAGLDYRIIADEIQDGAPGYYSNEYLVRNDSGIKTVEDLKGKILAVNLKDSGIAPGLTGEITDKDDEHITVTGDGEPATVTISVAETVSVTADPSPPPRIALPEQLVLGQGRYGR